jgi:hypothetical protein
MFPWGGVRMGYREKSSPRVRELTYVNVGESFDLILDELDPAGCVVVSSRALVTHLLSSPLVNTCFSSSLVPI